MKSLKKYHLPTPIYEALPFVYSITGVLMMFDILLIPLKLVGLLLFIAGLIIIKMRITHRYL